MLGANKTTLGIELGSTRIKAILIDDKYSPVASGSHNWENRLINGLWTYRIDDVWAGLRDCFQNLSADAKNRHGVNLSSVDAIGVSAMMHGYLVFNKNGKLIVPFRTWRNTTTEKAAAALTELFQFNIPQRWSIAHLYQAILNKEPFVKDIDCLTTLAGFVHWKLTGEKVLGIDDASGVFPVDYETMNYDAKMINQFNELISGHGIDLKIENILPKILLAGENAGTLTEEGARLLDPSGCFNAGINFCPPEGDAATGMVSTNTITERTGNVSAGTSIFAMIVLEKKLSKVYPEIDIVATPDGKPVAMVHCNNCTGDLDAWMKLFGEVTELLGVKTDKSALYTALYNKALEGDKDCGNLLSYNFYSGEHQIGSEQGRPLFVRLPDSNFTLANFMRTLMFSSLGTLKMGMDILIEKEGIRIDNLLGQGGLFKTKNAAQKLMAGAFNIPVSVMESAGEGGAWGIAILAMYMLEKSANNEQLTMSLEKFLSEKVFKDNQGSKITPNPEDVESFKIFMERYKAGLKIEESAVENLKYNYL